MIRSCPNKTIKCYCYCPVRQCVAKCFKHCTCPCVRVWVYVFFRYVRFDSYQQKKKIYFYCNGLCWIINLNIHVGLSLIGRNYICRHKLQSAMEWTNHHQIALCLLLRGTSFGYIFSCWLPDHVEREKTKRTEDTNYTPRHICITANRDTNGEWFQ